MADPLSKTAKQKLRALADVAHERELSSRLSKLDAQFARFRAGQINAFELNNLIHTFHDGPSRSLHKRYVLGAPELAVARAIALAVVTDIEAGPEVMQLVAPSLARFQSNARDDDDR